jgi:hypothetical protein
VPAEEVGQQLACVVVGRAGGAGRRHVDEQRRHRRCVLLVGLGHRRRGGAVGVVRPWNRVTGARRQLVTALLEPVAQPERGPAVDLVVGPDVLQELRVSRLEPRLVHHDAGAAVGDGLAGARRQVQRLELLEAVALLRDEHRVADHLVQVDEHLAPEDAVDLGLAGVVAAGEPLEHRSLVGGVVVHVQVGVAVEPLDHEVDEALEGVALAGRVVAPEAGVGRGGTVGPGRLHDAEEVLEAVLAGPRVALDVEEQVAGRRGREGCQPPGRRRLRRRLGPTSGRLRLGGDGGRRQQLVADPPVGALGELQARLVPEPVDEVERHAVDLVAVGARRQEGAGRDAGARQLRHRIGADPGDEAEVVVPPATPGRTPGPRRTPRSGGRARRRWARAGRRPSPRSAPSPCGGRRRRRRSGGGGARRHR